MLSPGETAVEEFRRRGFVVVERVVDEARVSRLRLEVDRLIAGSEDRGGVRNVLAMSADLRRLAHREVADVARRFLGRPARPVKLTIFDKTPEANWKVPMHQDVTIAVRRRREVAGFGPWSLKGGLPHVQAPAEVLESIVAIRLHLDETGESDGALRVVPASHQRGRLPGSAIRRLARSSTPVLCPVARGGALVMSPLLVHGSAAAEDPSRRRVLHFELTADELPGGLEWAC